MPTLSFEGDCWSLDIEPFESMGMWFAECPFCMANSGGRTGDEVAGAILIHIREFHSEEIYNVRKEMQ